LATTLRERGIALNKVILIKPFGQWIFGFPK
jgi:hypothetical protein